MLHRTNSFSCFQIVSLFRCTITHRFAKWYKITLLSNDTGTLTANIIVLLPYEITLLSNAIAGGYLHAVVLLPYEITLLSNQPARSAYYTTVLLPYEITLLSNKRSASIWPRWFYYLMKLHYSQTIIVRASAGRCFTTLWNYTTLKPQMRISCDTTIHRVTS